MEQVEIHIKGQIDKNQLDWLSGLSIAHELNDTGLRGLVADQSALYGVLLRLWDLGMQPVKAGFRLVRFRWKDKQSQPVEKEREICSFFGWRATFCC